MLAALRCGHDSSAALAPVIRAAALSLALAGGLGACGSSSPPARSSPPACRDFRSCYLDQGGNVLAGKDPAKLRHALTEAPGGHLYRDLSTLSSDVTTATAMQGGGTLTLVAAYAVAHAAAQPEVPDEAAEGGRLG